jgi:magnesium transporter
MRGELPLSKRPAWKERKAVLDHRLKDLLVFELTMEGNHEYKTVTLRGLYNYVLNVITTRPRGLHANQRHTATELNAKPPKSSVTSDRHRRGTIDFEGEMEWNSLASGVSADEGKRDSEDKETDVPQLPIQRLGSFGLESYASDGQEEPISIIADDGEGNKKRVSFSTDARGDILIQDFIYEGPKTNKVRKGRSKTVSEPILSTHHFTHRERLGGYLHPRDMRRLVAPFSATNEPELIVRRHAILLNMDPLRAIVLSDRLLVIVPNGADSILEQLEKRVRGGLQEMERSIFEHSDSNETYPTTMENIQPLRGTPPPIQADPRSWNLDMDLAVKEKELRELLAAKKSQGKKGETESKINDDYDADEWLDMDKRDWINVPFELQCVEAVLHVVCKMLFDEAKDLQKIALDSIDSLLFGNSSSNSGNGHDLLRRLKNDMSQMSLRVLGFIRALNLVLDDDEDLALMNLSRLISHPERFILPVSEKVLHEESDEPELILEAYLQQALSTTNALDSVRNELNTTEELMNMQLDAVRNRLLYINTATAFMTLAVGIASFIGSIFGMNLINPLEGHQVGDSPKIWNQVVLVSCIGSFVLFVFMMIMFARMARSTSFH